MQETINYLVNVLPTEVFLALVIIFLNIWVVIAFYIVKKFMPAFAIEEINKYRASLIGLVSGSYGIILALLVVGLWDWNLKAHQGTYREASNLAILTQFSLTLDSPLQTKTLDAIGQYITAVVHEEWELQRYGELSQKAEEALTKIFHVFYTSPISSEVIIIGVAEALDEIVRSRYERISQLPSLITSPIYFILFFGLILIGLLFSSYETQRHHIHLMGILIFTSILSYTIGFIIVLDTPYSGQSSINSDAFTTGVLERFKT